MFARAQKSTIVRSCVEPLVHIRTVPPGGAERIIDAVFNGLSPRSRYLRYHAPLPRLSEAVRRQLADLDGRHRSAIVAEVTDGPETAPIGLVEMADTGDGTAEVAIAVVDAWQSRGVGHRLLRAAAEHAEALGYTRLHGRVLPGNDAMRRLARRTFPQARLRLGSDTDALDVPIGPAASTVTHADVLADLLHRGG
jgi:GNAT superfamily N-acetyltransferase